MGTHAATEHNYYERVPIIDRESMRWPGGAAVAVGFVVSLESCDLLPPAGAVAAANFPGSFGRAPYPDVRAFSQREYGNRVGVFRVMTALDACDFRATVAVDATVTARCPAIVSSIRQRGWDVVGHGHAITQLISSAMSEREERIHIESALDTLERAFGSRPQGWHGQDYGESSRTPELLAGLGLRYVLDWPNDEQPYWMTTRQGRLLSLPMLIDFDDVFAHWQRKLSMERWQRSISDALDQLELDGVRAGRALILNLHPWLIGHPWRITYLRDVLADIRRRENVWVATPSEIAAWACATLK